MLFHVSLTLLLVTLNKFMSSASSLPQDYFVVLVCLSFSWGRHYSVSALNNVGSPILVFIPIALCKFEQVLPNISSFDQSTVSSSLKNLAKLKKLEKHSQSLFPNLVVFWFCFFAQIKINSIHIYIYTNIQTSTSWASNRFLNNFMISALSSLDTSYCLSYNHL